MHRYVKVGVMRGIKVKTTKPASNPAEIIIMSGLNSLATGINIWSQTAR